MEMQVWGVFMEIIQEITMKNTHTKICLYENYPLGSFCFVKYLIPPHSLYENFRESWGLGAPLSVIACLA